MKIYGFRSYLVVVPSRSHISQLNTSEQNIGEAKQRVTVCSKGITWYIQGAKVSSYYNMKKTIGQKKLKA